MKVRVVIVNGIPIVPDLEESRRLFSQFYGKPAGTRRPAPGEVERPLILDALELVYLAEKGLVEAEVDGRKLSYEELTEWAKNRVPRFALLYPVYRSLRDMGFVVRPGLKFGSDFTVYRHGPGIEHSLFVVHVFPPAEKRDPVELVKAGRLSHSVRKTFVLATVEPGGKPVYLMLKWFRP